MISGFETLIVGEAPGRFAGGLTRSRVSDLAGRPWGEWAYWRNLLEDYPGAGRGKGTAWNPALARAVADELKANGKFGGYRYIVLLGRRVSSALIPGGAGFPFFRWTTVPGIAGQVVVIPHTSGIVRNWNDPATVEQARRILRPLAGFDPDRQDEDATLESEPAQAPAGPLPVASEASSSCRPGSAQPQTKESEMTTRTRERSRRASAPRRSTTTHPADRDLMVAAFKAAGGPLTPKEAAAIVVESKLARPATSGTPLDYRLYSPVYRLAKADKVFKRVATEPHAMFEPAADAPTPPTEIVKAMKPIAKRIVAARAAEAAAA